MLTGMRHELKADSMSLTTAALSALIYSQQGFAMDGFDEIREP